MKLTRRTFLKLLAAGTSAAALPLVARAYLSRSASQSLAGAPRQLTAGTATAPVAVATPVPPAATMVAPTATAAHAATAAPPTSTPPAVATPPAAATATTVPTTPPSPAEKAVAARVWTWLRMFDLRYVPSSEADYRAHSGEIDAVMPLNGGKLQADATWLQEDIKLAHSWPRDLPELARRAGQLYMPAVGNDHDGLIAVLEDPQLQKKAVTGLVAMAQADRFDAPWDGVYLDFEGVEADYHEAMSGFLDRIAREVKDAGLLLGISVGGVYDDPGVIPSAPEDVYDLKVVSELADVVDIRCYDYWYPPPRSIAPFWWIEACLEYGLGKGIQPEVLSAGFANFSRYWPDSDRVSWEDVTFVRGMDLLQQAGAEPEWVERNDHGLVREKRATVGAGHLWIHDGDTYKEGLDLIDKYRLRGNAIFAPGMGDPADWSVLAAWKERRQDT